MKTKANRDPSLIYPELLKRVEAGLAKARAAGLHAYLFEGYRSPERSDELFAQGRTLPGPVITKAKAGESYHNFGLAVDIAFDADPKKDGLQWTWDANFQSVAPFLKGEGLEWAGDWVTFREQAHFQLTGGLTLPDCRALLEKGGTSSIWKRVDELLGIVSIPQPISLPWWKRILRRST